MGTVFQLILPFVVVSALTGTPAHARGGDGSVVGNGAGGLEQVLLFSWRNLGDFLSPCLADPSCYVDASGKEMLSAILASHPEELRRGRLRFIENSGSQSVTETAGRVGSPVVINLAPLYASGAGLSLGQSIDLLLSALASHHPEQLSPAFEQTRKGVAAFWSARIEARDLRKLGHAEISVMAIHHGRPSVLAGAGEGFINILPQLERQLICAKDERAQMAAVRNSFWLDPEMVSRSQVELALYGRISYNCENRGQSRLVNGTFKLGFAAAVINGSSEQFLRSPGQYELKVKTQVPRLSLFDLH